MSMKGSFAAPLLFFLALLFASIGSVLGSVAPWALSALALALACRAVAAVGAVDFRLSFPVFGFGILVAFNVLFVSPAYTPAGLYHPLLLVAGYLLARRLTGQAIQGVALPALGIGAVLSLWGLAQIGPLGVERAHALFETPATYAAVLNLLLIPLLAAVLTGKRGAPLTAIVMVLASALFASDSRGGLVSLAAGLGFAALFAMRARLLDSRSIGLTLALLAAGWILATALRTTPSANLEALLGTQVRAESSLSRLELYALSWNAWAERPLIGSGYLTFRYVLEQGRARVPSYGESNETWFVHNDYLQTLLELGPIGFVAFLGFTVLPALLAYRNLRRLPEADRAIVVASAASLAAMSVHALVDYPFYIPVCLLLYGVLLGVLDSRLGRPLTVTPPTWRANAWYPPARAAALTVAAIILLRPVLAEAAAGWGMRNSAAGDGQSAAFWLGAAQRLDPRDWRYHWYTGQFWDAQAVDSGRREAARLAAEAYAAGFAVNPLEVKNLLGKISVNRRHRDLLDSPADAKTMREWMTQAAALAPLSPAVRWELAR
jgi:O-antigen ligase